MLPTVWKNPSHRTGAFTDLHPECCALVQAQRAKTAAAHPGGGHGASASFVCLYNTLFDQNWCKEELYALCIPGAALALLCPSWLDVPSWWTLINLHSVSIHALLVLYPVLLVVGGYRPSPRRVPQVLAFLFGTALPIYFLNKSLYTNFYFLNNPTANVITCAFTRFLGERYYILGFLPAIAAALAVMYLPWAAKNFTENRRKH